MKKKIKNIRYRGMMISVFILLLLVLVILGLNIHHHAESKKEANRLVLIHRLHDTAQLMTQNLFDLKLSHENKEKETAEGRSHIKETLHRLQTNSGRFSHKLQILDNGGNAFKIGKLSAVVPALTSTPDRENLQAINREWNHYTQLINRFLSDDRTEDQVPDTLLLTQIQQSNKRLKNTLSAMTNRSLEQSQQKNKLFELIQIAGISGTVVYFLIYMSYLARKFRLIIGSSGKANEELEELMSSINEGLFWVDRDLQIGTRHSDYLKHLLDKPAITESSLKQLLHESISEEDWETTQSFIKQMFNERVKDKLIKDLNPLDRIRTQVRNTKGTPINRYLHFNFTRSYETNNNYKTVKHLLASVSDVTATVDLEKQLKRQREQNILQLSLLTSIMHMDKDMLDTFVSHAYAKTERINDILKQPDKKQKDLFEKTKEILREIHSLKGEASALELEQFITISENFEDQVVKLQKNINLTGNHFLPLTVNLEQLIEQLTQIDLLSRRLNESQSGSNKVNEVEPVSPLKHRGEPIARRSRNAATLTAYFTKLVKEIAVRNKKQVRLDTSGLSYLSKNKKLTETLNDVIIQLLRNAVVHGIETPEQRRAIGKNETGTIKILFTPPTGGKGAVLSVEDDGGGIDYEKIRQKTVISGICTPEDAQALTSKQLTLLMFDSGFSTLTKSNQDAGRGIGLDVIKSRIDKLKGKIQLNTQKNINTRFIIRLP